MEKVIDPLKHERELLRLLLEGRHGEARELNKKLLESDREATSRLINTYLHSSTE